MLKNRKIKINLDKRTLIVRFDCRLYNIVYIEIKWKFHCETIDLIPRDFTEAVVVGRNEKFKSSIYLQVMMSPKIVSGNPGNG